MSGVCRIDGCTVVETGRCALEKDPDACPNRIENVEADRPEVAPAADLLESRGVGVMDGIGVPVLTPPVDVPSFPKSTTLELEVIERMMSRRYVTVVGILGDPESGKTACLASLYLLVSNAQLEGWTFADSRSLMGFEEIARGARRWNEGQPPEQMTVHTELDDERQPGFLHLRLRYEADGRHVDLALPDLPGEWTKSLIRSSRTDRLEFIKSADVVWLVVDGRTLANREHRHGTIIRLGQLIGRLRSVVGETMPRLLLVITHRDKYAIPEEILKRVADELSKHDATADVVAVAPFSDDTSIDPGFGLASLIRATVGPRHHVPSFWPSTMPKVGERFFLSFRSDQ